MVNRIWPIAGAGKADNVSSVSASAYHIGGGPNYVNPGQILLFYDTSAYWENRVLNLDCRVLSNSFCIQLAIVNKYYSKSKTNIV